MTTGARKGKASILDDRIDILTRNVVEASPTRQISRTVVAILVLVRVSALVLCQSANSHRWPNQDKRADDKDSVQLSEYCFDACEALNTAIQGKNADDLNESAKMALKDLERCIRLSRRYLLPY